MSRRIKVVYIETFDGKKYILSLDRDYEKVLLTLFRNLFENAKLGSVACISLRYMDEEKYEKLNPSPDFLVSKKGKNNGKGNNGQGCNNQS